MSELLIQSVATAHFLKAVIMQVIPQTTVAQRVHTAIVQNVHLNSCDIKCETDASGKLTIQGEANTFFAKQMAQEILRNIEGVRVIENGLTVASSDN